MGRELWRAPAIPEGRPLQQAWPSWRRQASREPLERAQCVQGWVPAGEGESPGWRSRDWSPHGVHTAGRGGPGGPGPALGRSVRGRADPWAPWAPKRPAQSRGCWYDGGTGAAGTCLLDPCCPSAPALLCGARRPRPNLLFPMVWVCPLPPCPGWGCSEAGPGASSVPACPQYDRDPWEGGGSSWPHRLDPRGSAPASLWTTPTSTGRAPRAGPCHYTLPRIKGSPAHLSGSSEHSSVTTS